MMVILGILPVRFMAAFFGFVIKTVILIESFQLQIVLSLNKTAARAISKEHIEVGSTKNIIRQSLLQR